MEYTIIIEKDPESGWYVGKCIQVPAAMSQGETLDELMKINLLTLKPMLL
jgi:predicted RNase H-like HicB family nuclease